METSTDRTTLDQEQRLDEAVLAYLKAREAGATPDPKAWLGRYPELAAGLEAFFAGQDHLERLALQLLPPAPTRAGAEETAAWSGDPAGAAPAGPPPLGGYEILGELGRGGMGVVYKARQKSLGRTVALKMILAGAHAGAEDLARFHAEAEAVAHLNHLNIIQIHEVGRRDGLPFFSLEFAEGGSLAARLDGTPWQLAEAAALVATLARAVEHAHQRGIVHRDLKPGNILLASGGREPPDSRKESGGSRPPLAGFIPKVTDFGLAKRVDEAGQTQSGSVLGTPSYMAPEQAAGRVKEVGPLADVYALGAMLYELLTGRPPFRAATAWDTVRQVIEDEPVAPRLLNPKAGRDPETVCLKCLQKDPRRRYASAGELADDLERFLRREPIRARSAGLGECLARWVRRHPGGATALGATLGSLVLVLAVVLGYNRQLGEQLDRTEEARRDLRAALTRELAERLDRDLEQLAGVPRMMALTLARRGDWREEQLASWARDAVGTDPRLFGVCVAFEPFQFDPGQKDFALYVYRTPKGLEARRLRPENYKLYRDWPWYQRPRQSGRASWSEPFLDTGGADRPIITYSVPLVRGGKFRGVVTADLSVEYLRVLRDWLRELRLGREGYAFVLSPEGTFISHPTYRLPEKITELKAFRDDQALHELAARLLRGRAGRASAVDPVTGRQSSFDFAPVPSAGWVLVVVTPE